MVRLRESPGRLLLLVFIAGLVGCQRPAAQSPRTVEPSTISIRLPARFGALRRPAVEFSHGQHTKALNKEGCKTCHQRDRSGKLIPLFARTGDGHSRDALMDLYHSRCMGCHKQRSQGPRACGECHVKRPRTRSLRVEMAFDYSLHYRHVTSLGKDKSCEQCHHLYDKAQRKLVYERGGESNCRDCHKARRNGGTPALREAAHQDCVGCHEKRTAASQPTGPTLCVGCHDATHQQKIKRVRPERLKLAYSPTVKRRQPDQLWLSTAGGVSRLVGFDHQAHEPRARFCSTCHHETLAACKSCHTLTGKKEGRFITVATAYHQRDAKQSCVGCHARKARASECAGCHEALTAHRSKQACVTCHNGPRPGEPGPAALPPTTQLPPLPPYSKDYPEMVVIKALAKEFAPSKMPHGRIVARLFRESNRSKLARQFHGRTETLCAGCHHRTPAGRRSPPCASCHGRTDHATRDQPGLKAAYHRQCMGCHQRMGLTKLMGCHSCHAKAGAEAKR